MNRSKSLLSALVLTVVLITTAGAAVPGLITYQGLLADSTGNPANGLYLVQFRIYDAESGGATLWDNAFRTIQVTDGLFAYSLGDSTAFPDDLFDSPDRWLGIRVGTDPELSPRTRLVSSPYSQHAAKADSLAGDAGYVHIAGDEMNGNLNFDIGDDGDNELILYTSSGRGNFSLLDNGLQRIFLGAQSGGGAMIIQDDSFIFGQFSGDNTFGGGVTLAQADGTTGASLAAGTDASQAALRLYDNTGSQTVYLLGNSTGDGAVVLHDNSINSAEILDNSITSTDIAADAVGSSEIINGSVLSADIADGTLSSADYGTASVDAVALGINSVSSPDIVDGQVLSVDIADNSITEVDIAANAVLTSEIADGSVTSSDIADNTVSTTDILDNSITTSDIATSGVSSAEIADGSVTTVDITDGTITAADILDNSIITADIGTGQVTTSDIADGGIALIDLSSSIVPAVGSIELGSGGATLATPTTLDSFIVTSPGTGYLWVTVMGQYYFAMPAPASTSIIEAGAIGLCTSPASDATCDGTYELIYYQDAEDATPNGLNHTEWFSIQRVIPVIATSYTFYINGEATSTSDYDLHLYHNPKATALFVPGTLTMATSPAVPNNPDLEQK